MGEKKLVELSAEQMLDTSGGGWKPRVKVKVNYAEVNAIQANVGKWNLNVIKVNQG